MFPISEMKKSKPELCQNPNPGLLNPTRVRLTLLLSLTHVDLVLKKAPMALSFFSVPMGWVWNLRVKAARKPSS